MSAKIPVANADGPRKRITILGAGVIGQVFAARLADAGHDVSLIARGQTLESLRKDGVRVRRSNESARRVLVDVVDFEQAQDLTTEVLIVCVRREQLTAAMPQIRSLPFERVVLLQNAGGNTPATLKLGRPLIRAFPGIGGEQDASGAIHYIAIDAQPTTFAAEDDPETVMQLFRATGLALTTTDDMPAWAATHDIMMAAFGAAIVAHSGDAAALGRDQRAMRIATAAIREGLRARLRQGLNIRPAALYWLFVRLPPFAATKYWSKAMQGPTGTLAIAPHMRATADSELLAIIRGVLAELGDATAPTLRTLVGPVASRWPSTKET